jgi:exodeoxyribonuclease VII small subunit
MTADPAQDPSPGDEPPEDDAAAQEGTEDAPAHHDVASLGYEEARDALAEVVQRLESGGLTLEESLALWERGEGLARVCQERLDGARARLTEALARTDAEDDDEG